MSIVGPLFHPGQLEDRVIHTLKTWLPAYLNEVSWRETVEENLPALAESDPEATEEQLTQELRDRIAAGTIKPRQLATPNSYATVSEYDRFPEQQLPAIIVAAPGMVERPVRSGDGFLSGTWTIEVSATVSANNGKDTRRLAQMYLSAIQGAILQRRSLGDPFSAASLTMVEYADIPNERRRSIIAAASAFEVSVHKMLSTNQGPVSPEPPDPIPATWPVVSEVNVSIEKEL
jgi:hypothetical protein